MRARVYDMNSVSYMAGDVYGHGMLGSSSCLRGQLLSCRSYKVRDLLERSTSTTRAIGLLPHRIFTASSVTIIAGAATLVGEWT